jgi:hypothetical protein
VPLTVRLMESVTIGRRYPRIRCCGGMCRDQGSEVISAETADLPEARKPVVERERDIRNQKGPQLYFS